MIKDIEISSNVYYYINILKCFELHYKIHHLILSLQIYLPNILKDWKILSMILDNFILNKSSYQGKLQSDDQYQYSENVNLTLIDINRQSFMFFEFLLNNYNIKNNLKTFCPVVDEEDIKINMDGQQAQQIQQQIQQHQMQQQNCENEVFKLLLNTYLNYNFYINELRKYKTFVDISYKSDNIFYRTPSQMSNYDNRLPLKNLNINENVLYEKCIPYFLDLQFKPLNELILELPLFRYFSYDFKNIKIMNGYKSDDIIFGCYDKDITFLSKSELKCNTNGEKLLLVLNE